MILPKKVPDAIDGWQGQTDALMTWAGNVSITAAATDRTERCGNAIGRIMASAANLRGALRELQDTWPDPGRVIQPDGENET